MNFWKRYPADYQRKTARLTLAQHGAYTLLLDELYTTEAPLPPEIDELCRICRAMSKTEQEAVRAIANQFFPINGDGQRHNKRADEEITEAAPALNAARENGKLGGRPNKTSENPLGNPLGNPEKKGYIATAPPEPIENPVGNPVGCEPENPVGSKSMKKGQKEPKKPRRNPVGFQTETQKEPSGKAPQILEIREEKEKEKEPPPAGAPLAAARPRATKRCPIDFEPSAEEMAAMALECPGVDLDRELLKLRDCEFKKPHSDWPATWRTWMRKAFDDMQQRRQTPTRPMSFREQDTAAAASRVHDLTGGMASPKPQRAAQEIQDAPAIAVDR